MPQPEAPTNPVDERFSLLWPEPLREAMEQLATKHDRSLAAEVRQALREYVERENGHNGTGS